MFFFLSNFTCRLPDILYKINQEYSSLAAVKESVTGKNSLCYPQRKLKSQPKECKNHMMGNIVIGHNQHRFMRERFCLINLISSCFKVTYLIDQGKPVDVIFLDLSKAFSTFSQRHSGQDVRRTARQKHNAVSEKLGDRSGPKSFNKWAYISDW